MPLLWLFHYRGRIWVVYKLATGYPTQYIPLTQVQVIFCSFTLFTDQDKYSYSLHNHRVVEIGQFYTILFIWNGTCQEYFVTELSRDVYWKQIYLGPKSNAWTGICCGNKANWKVSHKNLFVSWPSMYRRYLINNKTYLYHDQACTEDVW